MGKVLNSYMFLRFFLVFFLVSGILPYGAKSSPEPADLNNLGTIEMLVPSDDLRDFQALIRGRNIKQIRDYGGWGSRRNVVELVLFFQALRYAGFEGEIRFLIQENYRRILRKAESQGYLVANSVWRSDLDQGKFLITDALIRKGEFKVGVYVRPENQTVLEIRSIEQLRSLHGVSNRNWPVDWCTLKAFGVKNLFHVRNWNLMMVMVASGRVDFMLAPFSSRPDMAHHYQGARVVPVPGVAVLMKGSRHWAVSKTHVHSEAIYKILQTGLDKLRQEGLVEKAYRDSGFFSSQTRDWTVLSASCH